MKNKLNVLIIDQSPLVAPRIKNLLHELTGKLLIAEAGNFLDASEIFEYSVPDVVLLDLPCQQLIEMLVKIKTGHPSVKVIVFTNYTSTDFMMKCLQSGADYFLEKSIEFNLIPLILCEMLTEDLFEII